MSESLGPEWSIEGQYTEGIMDVHEISAKQLAIKSGIHESTLSRFFRGKAIRDRQLLKIGMALGRIAAEQDHQKRKPVRTAEPAHR